MDPAGAESLPLDRLQRITIPRGKPENEPTWKLMDEPVSLEEFLKVAAYVRDNNGAKLRYRCESIFTRRLISAYERLRTLKEDIAQRSLDQPEEAHLMVQEAAEMYASVMIEVGITYRNDFTTLYPRVIDHRLHYRHPAVSQRDSRAFFVIWIDESRRTLIIPAASVRNS